MKKFNRPRIANAKKNIKIHKPKHSVRYYVWIYFIFFTVFILLLLWLFQYFFLQNYYQSAKISDIHQTAARIEESYNDDNIENITRGLAFDNSLCIIVTNEMGTIKLSEITLGSFSYFVTDINKNFGMFLFELRGKLDKSSEDYITQIHKNENFKSQEIFYVSNIESDDGETLYMFIEATIDPIDSTATIIKEQLIYITIILFELAFIVTIFISKRISKPIVDITKTAKVFGSGDYSVHFDGKGYHEVEELSTVLNNAKNEISKVSELRKDLIANISHDLRTPLTMVKAYAEMIRDLSGDNPIKRQEHIQVIIDEADRLSNLVNNILELSKLESGNLDLNLTEFSVHEKMNAVMSRYKLMIETNGYDIQFIPDDDKIIYADSDKLDQVIYNFINNAINYSGEDKKIRINQINKTDVVRIEIVDNGKGISKELLPLIFDRYYRDAKYKREVVGTGLGLSICKEILKKHGFAFGVQSEEGKGSTFWFEAKISEQKKKLITEKRTIDNDN